MDKIQLNQNFKEKNQNISSIEQAQNDSQNKKITKIDDSKKKTYNKYYFNGEYDSNQTLYERLSNHSKICTVAKNDKVGLTLHTFLRNKLLIVMNENGGCGYLMIITMKGNWII